MDSFSQQTLILLLVICIGSYIFLFGFLKKLNQWYYVDSLQEKKHNLPPGDMGWPVLGNTLSVLKAFRSNHCESFINDMVERHGRTGIYKSYLFGSPSVIICNTEGCKKVLTDSRFAAYQSRSMKKLLDSKLVSCSASEHRRLRKLLSYPISGNEALALYLGYISDVVNIALEEWSSMSRPIEFVKEMHKITFKAFVHVFMGNVDESIHESMEKYNNDFVDGIKLTYYGIPGVPIQKALKAKNMLEKIFLQMMDDKRSKMNRKSDGKIDDKVMMDLLLEIEDENGQKFSNKDICSLLLSFLVAGYQSIAQAGSWATIYMHKHPEVLRKAREEQREIFKSRPSTQKRLNLNEISQMEYLAKVIDETLRNTSPFTLIRYAQEDGNVNGYFIPKGWRVLLWLNAIHMDPEIYMNPKEFIPSRWDNQKQKLGSFLAFGAGSRVCLGATFAKFQISIFLHHFLLNYKLEQMNPECPIIYSSGIPKLIDNCLARVIKLP